MNVVQGALLHPLAHHRLRLRRLLRGRPAHEERPLPGEIRIILFPLNSNSNNDVQDGVFSLLDNAASWPKQVTDLVPLFMTKIKSDEVPTPSESRYRGRRVGLRSTDRLP